MNQLFEYIGKSDKLKNAIVEIERETEKSCFVKLRKLGGAEIEQARCLKKMLIPRNDLFSEDA